MLTKIRLYLIAGAAIAVLAGFSWLLWQLWDQSRALAAAELANSRLTIERDMAFEANAKTNAALDKIVSARQSDNLILTQLGDKLTSLQVVLSKTQSERTQLKQSDPNVKDFLNTPIPDSLRRR